MRPPDPVPVTSDSLMSFSARSLRTIGERTKGPTPSPLAPAAGAGGASAGDAVGGAAVAVVVAVALVVVVRLQPAGPAPRSRWR